MAKARQCPAAVKGLAPCRRGFHSGAVAAALLPTLPRDRTRRKLALPDALVPGPARSRTRGAPRPDFMARGRFRRSAAGPQPRREAQTLNWEKDI